MRTCHIVAAVGTRRAFLDDFFVLGTTLIQVSLTKLLELQLKRLIYVSELDVDPIPELGSALLFRNNEILPEGQFSSGEPDVRKGEMLE